MDRNGPEWTRLKVLYLFVHSSPFKSISVHFGPFPSTRLSFISFIRYSFALTLNFRCFFMPIMWRYLLSQYLRVLLLCSTAFITVLLTMRLDEVAHFATLGASALHILWFTLSQVPYVLPIAIPVSSLVSSTLLIQRLSNAHELTALRACGMGFRDILAPILIAAALLACLNFYIVSELATDSHLSTNLVKSELRSLNPLLLAHNKHLMRLKGFYFDTLGASQMGESASDTILAMPNKHNNRLNLLVAKNLQATPTTFTGEGVTLITGLASDSDQHFDHLMIENIGHATTSVEDFSQLIQKKVWTLNNDHLQLPLLLVRLETENQLLEEAQAADMPTSELKRITRNIHRSYTEIFRRLSIAIAAFTFTLMGAAFGISISRYHTSHGLAFVIGLAALYLISYFTAKGMDHHLIASSTLYLIPHLLIVGCALWALRRAAKGIE